MATYDLAYTGPQIDELLASIKGLGLRLGGVLTPGATIETPLVDTFWFAPAGTYTYGESQTYTVNTGYLGIIQYMTGTEAWSTQQVLIGTDAAALAACQAAVAELSEDMQDVETTLNTFIEKNIFNNDTAIGTKSKSFMKIAYADGVYTITRVKAGGLYYTYITMPTYLVVGKTYKMRFDYVNGATIQMVCGLTQTLLTSDAGWLQRFAMPANSSGSAEIEFTYTNEYVYFEFWNGSGTSNNKTITISNLEIMDKVEFVEKDDFNDVITKQSQALALINDDIFINHFDWDSAEIGRTNAAYTIAKGENVGEYVIHCTASKPAFYYVYIMLPSLVVNKQYQIRFRVKSTSSEANTLRIRQETTSADLYTGVIPAYHDGWITLDYIYNNSGSGNTTARIVIDGSGMTSGSYLYITDFQVGTDRIDQLWNASDANESYRNKIRKLFSLPNSKFSAVCPQLKDVYLDLVGDSIYAFQWSTPTKIFAADGVTRVPPTCDLQAVAYMLWQRVKWGEVNYRRFDDGKASLVSAYDSRWADDSEAFFIESGTFYTQYVRNALSPVMAVVTTAVDSGHFATAFDMSETQSTPQQQRNIPKRFSSDANASIQFTIPAGYSKFDFVYHAHTLGDNVSVAISRGNGVVKYNNKPNDWANAIEANGATIDLSLTPCLTGAGDDTYGIPNKRIHFQISDTSADTIVIITKSADTTKYLIYWGIEFWGTTSYPYALHLDNMAVGGYKENQIYALRGSMIKAINPTAIIMEVSMNTLYSMGYNEAVSQISTNLANFASYLNGYDVAAWIPHEPVLVLSNPDRRLSYRASEELLHENGFPCLFNMARIIETMLDIFYPDLSLNEFMDSLGNSGLHLNNTGHSLYKGAWESVL